MSNEVVKLREDAAALAEKAAILNDLSGMKPDERMKYYMRVCETLGLNPLTVPFAYIQLNGELKLYAKKDATDQLRRIYRISVRVVDRTMEDDLYTVTVQTSDPSGRCDEDIGSVVFIYPNHYWEYDEAKRSRVRRTHPKGGQRLVGEDKANAMMKATTKAKRRATLSHCGLGFLDESEIIDIPKAEVGGIFAPDEMHGERMTAEIKTFPGRVEAAPEDSTPRRLPAPDHSELMTSPLDAFFKQDTLTVPLQMDERFGDVDWAAFSRRMVELIGNGTGREGCLARLRADNQEQLVQCKGEAQTAYLPILNAFKDARQRTPMRS